MQRIRLGAAIVAASICAAVQAGDVFGWKYEGWNKKHPRTPLATVAAAIDELEREIDCYGSVTVKQPDVWGEARWTKHRQDFEKTLAAELGNFKFTVNA